MKITDYFASVERGLRQNANIAKVDAPQAFLTSDDYNGLLRCRVHFWDGSYLSLLPRQQQSLIQFAAHIHAPYFFGDWND